MPTMGTTYTPVATCEMNDETNRLARSTGQKQNSTSCLSQPTPSGGPSEAPGGFIQPPHYSSLEKSSDDDDVRTDRPIFGATSKNDLDEKEPEQCQDRPRTPIVTGPIIELRGREVIFAITVFFLVAIVVGLIVVLASDKVKKVDEAQSSSTCKGRKKPEKICNTSLCIQIAAAMMDKMDVSINACDNFWQYSCGGWLARTEIPPSMEAWGVDNEAERKIKVRVRRILEGSIIRNETRSADRKFKTFFRKCMNVRDIEREGVRPFLDIIKKFGGWAILPDWNLDPNSGLWSVQKALELLQFTFNVDAFFNLVVVKDVKSEKVDANIIQFDQGGITLELADYQKNESTSQLILTYKLYMTKMALLFNVSQDDAKLFAESTFKFEKELAEIYQPDYSEHRQSPDSMYNRITIGQLENVTDCDNNKIKWLELLSSVYGGLDKNSIVLVTNRDYLTNVSLLIARTEERDVNNYLVWQLLHQFAAPLLSKVFSDLHSKFKRADRSHAGLIELRQTFCQQETLEWFDNAVTAEFVKQRATVIETDVEEMIKNIKEEFQLALRNNAWMDLDTQKEALEKLQRLDKRIGYAKFITNDTALDQHYETFEVKDTMSFFDVVLSGLQHQRIVRRRTLEFQSELDEFVMPPLEINAYYSFTQNVVGFSAGLLQRPFYDIDSPKCVNYGSLGSTIAHEINHAFDRSGSRYDESGNLRNWWSNTTWGEFLEKTDCIENYYLRLKESDTEDKAEEDSDDQLNENIADMSGLKHAYGAYQKSGYTKEPMLPGLDLTNNQVFFVAFAQNWCKSRKKESLQKFRQSSSHALEDIRVLGSISQNPTFSQEFQCSPTHAMNPPHKCSIW